MSNAAVAIIGDESGEQAPSLDLAQLTPPSVEEHMLAIASILFDALSDLCRSAEDRLDRFDTKNTSAIIGVSATLE